MIRSDNIRKKLSDEGGHTDAKKLPWKRARKSVLCQNSLLTEMYEYGPSELLSGAYARYTVAMCCTAALRLVSHA